MEQERLITRLADDIYTIDSIIEPEFCEELIEFFNLCHRQKISHRPGKNVACYEIDLKCRLKQIEKYKSKRTDTFETYSRLNSKIEDVFDEICRIVRDLRPGICLTSYSGNNIRKVYGETLMHTDGIDGGIPGYVRSLTIIISLNDDYSGGIFSFPDQNLTHRIKKCSALVFPPLFEYPHAVSNIGDNEYRYTLHTWVLENDIE